ncbi:MAG: BON domain-containing protein [Rhodanobacter sp.]
MRPIRLSLFYPAAGALALAFCSGAFAQQSAPVSATSANAAADNTVVNQRDRSTQALTPMDQPNTKVDIKLAADVRSAIVKDDALSVWAHNLKLVAADGVVTLRGPVANAQEKARVQSLVGAVPGVERVDNQLDVKTP